MPSTTGSTASRWLGLGETETTISPPAFHLARAGGAEVILHVARALRAGGIDFALEFGEDLLDVLAHHVGQQVEAAAVRHADHDFVDVVGRGALQDLFQDDERGLAAFQREAFLADEARVQEMLEFLGGDQVAQDAEARFAFQRPVVLARLHALLQPALLLRHLDVHVLAADFAAVGVAQGFQNFAQCGDGLGVGPSPMASPRLPVRNSRSRSQMVRP